MIPRFILVAFILLGGCAEDSRTRWHREMTQGKISFEEYHRLLAAERDRHQLENLK